MIHPFFSGSTKENALQSAVDFVNRCSNAKNEWMHRPQSIYMHQDLVAGKEKTFEQTNRHNVLPLPSEHYGSSLWADRKEDLKTFLTAFPIWTLLQISLIHVWQFCVGNIAPLLIESEVTMKIWTSRGIGLMLFSVLVSKVGSRL